MKIADDDEFPRFSIATGIKSGLTVALQVFESDMDYLCRSGYQGFKVGIFSKNVFQKYMFIPLGGPSSTRRSTQREQAIFQITTK